METGDESRDQTRDHEYLKVLIAGSTGSALRAVRLPTFTSRQLSGAISLPRKCDGFLVLVVSRHHSPGHPRNLVGERDGRDLSRTPRQQCREPRPMLNAMDLGIADNSERTDHEQAAQIAVTLFADTAELVLTPTRVLLRNEPNPG
jgi:hypothetical protein